MLLKNTLSLVINDLDVQYSCRLGKLFNLSLKNKKEDVGVSSDGSKYYDTFILTNQLKEKVYAKNIFIFDGSRDNMMKIHPSVKKLTMFDHDFLSFYFYRLNLTKLTIKKSKLLLGFNWLPDTLRYLDVKEVAWYNSEVLKNFTKLKELKISLKSLNLKNLKFIKNLNSIVVNVVNTRGYCKTKLNWRRISTDNYTLYKKIKYCINPICLKITNLIPVVLSHKLLPRLVRLELTVNEKFKYLKKFKSLRHLTLIKNDDFVLDFNKICRQGLNITYNDYYGGGNIIIPNEGGFKIVNMEDNLMWM
jgi:hypothetical protein